MMLLGVVCLTDWTSACFKLLPQDKAIIKDLPYQALPIGHARNHLLAANQPSPDCCCCSSSYRSLDNETGRSWMQDMLETWTPRGRERLDDDGTWCMS